MKNGFKIYWADEAKEGLEAIIQYLEHNWSHKEIKSFFIRLEECLDNISTAPHRSKNSLRKPGMREYQHSPQTTIFYTFDKSAIYILLVWSNYKNMSN